MATLDLDDIATVMTALMDKGSALGIFDSTLQHEPKSSPGRGLHLAMWNATMDPVAEVSGLNAASVRVEFQMRVMSSMIAEPMDGIDPEVVGAAGMLMNTLAGGFTLGGEVIAVDVLGAYGEKLRGKSGYLSISGQQGDGVRMYRVMDVFVPVVFDGCWTFGE